jgi:methanogenic corrinoid protein MtbC1
VAVRPAGTLISAPVTQEFVDKIGADAYGANAALKAKELI